MLLHQNIDSVDEKKNYSVKKKTEDEKNKKKLGIEIKKHENKILKTKIENRNKSY